MNRDIKDGSVRNELRDKFRSDVWRITDLTPFLMEFTDPDGNRLVIKSATELSVTED